LVRERSDAAGSIDEMDFVDGLPDLVRHRAPIVVPIGAPIRIRGWALNGKRQELATELGFLLGNRRIEAAFNGQRPDIADVFQSAALARCGFVLGLATAGLEAGPHKLTGVVRFADDQRWHRFEKKLVYLANGFDMRVGAQIATAPGFRGALDLVRDHDRQRSAELGEPFVVLAGTGLQIGGWMFHETEQIVRVAARLGGFGAVIGRIGLPRVDVASLLGEPAAEGSGFAIPLRLDGIAPGSYTLSVEYETATGWSAIPGTRTIVVVPAPDVFPSAAHPLREPLEARFAHGDRSFAANEPLRLTGSLAAASGTEVFMEIRQLDERAISGAQPQTFPVDWPLPAGGDEPGFALEISPGRLPRGRYEAAILATTPDRRGYRRAPSLCTFETIASSGRH